MASPELPASTATSDDYEEAHVHSVYEAIAPHFSSTRYKPWPVIQRFLATQPRGAIGLDAGCGNGKNLPRPSHHITPRDDSVSDEQSAHAPLFTLASDRSAALVGLARAAGTAPPSEPAQQQPQSPRQPKPSQQDRARKAPPKQQQPAPHPYDALLADARALPHPPQRFDFALSAAVVHHLSTRARRVAALAELVRALRRPRGRGLVTAWALEQRGSRRGWDVGGAQDVMVPWVLQGARGAKPADGDDEKDDKGDDERGAPRTFQRFYHLYCEGELEADVRAAGGRVVEAGYEKDNWWVVFAAADTQTSSGNVQKPP